jgi:glutamate formiminotransferase/formiminotetrahydrofolate cyclodeaminase
VGWYIDEYERAQISINLTDFDVTPPHVAFDEVEAQAAKKGLRVTGSELVGLVPLEAMLQAGRHYLDRQGSSAGVPESQVIETAIQSLGLRELGAFDPKERVIEYRIAEETPLADLTVRDFVDVTSTDAPAPGGGSVAALMGSLSGALSAMVANLTIGKKGYKEVTEEMKALAFEGQRLKKDMLFALDADTKAFDEVMAAMRLPKSTEEEAEARDQAMEDANKKAIDVPLGVLRQCREALEPADAVSQRGNRNSLSDAGVAALAAWAGGSGAFLNVLINLPGVSDDDYAVDTMEEAGQIMTDINERGREIVERVVTELMNEAQGGDEE